MEIYKTLKELRQDKGIRQDELAKMTGLSQSSISSWENASRVPSIEAVVTLSKFYGVTTDYILGVDADFKTFEQTNPPPITKRNRQRFFQKLMEIDIEDLTSDELNAIIGISVNAIKELKKLKN